MTLMLVNLTPHPLRFFDTDGAELGLVPPSGKVARLATTANGTDPAAQVDGADITVARVSYGQVDGLPAPADGVRYVVPLLVALARTDRDDLLVPHEQQRNTDGTVIGCRSLGRVTDGT